VGDTPVIGAGTYADDATCAVSGTGKGEVFIRACVAHEVAARMRWAGQTLEEAATGVVTRTLQEIGGPGTGGLVAVDAQGNVAMPFNSEGMYRGCAGQGRRRTVAIHGS
jgi:beta-aspartyl-peptidase (threonine type)